MTPDPDRFRPLVAHRRAAASRARHAVALAEAGWRAACAARDALAARLDAAGAPPGGQVDLAREQRRHAHLAGLRSAHAAAQAAAAERRAALHAARAALAQAQRALAQAEALHDRALARAAEAVRRRRARWAEDEANRPRPDST